MVVRVIRKNNLLGHNSCYKLVIQSSDVIYCLESLLKRPKWSFYHALGTSKKRVNVYSNGGLDEQCAGIGNRTRTIHRRNYFRS
jgi:hypothetical protein